MKLFLTECRHCKGIIRSDINYCHHCGQLVLSLPTSPPRYKPISWVIQRLSPNILLREGSRAAVAATIFGLSFLLFRWALTIYLPLSPDLTPSLPTTWNHSILALVAMVLLASFVVGSYLWAMIFGVCLCAGYFGLLPHPLVGIGGALITTLVGGPMAGGICCLPARLGKRIGTKKRLLIGLGVGIVIVVIGIIGVPGLTRDAELPASPKTHSTPPPMTIDTSRRYTATIETEKGDLVLELFASDVPITVNNFVFLARDGFYDGLTFHRVIPGFVAQGGCPVGDGSGGPGYRFDDEITGHTHVTGALSMANAGPNTNGSQFFITYDPQSHLDGKHTVFGQLIEGMGVLESLENGDVMIRITIQES